jgi:hypothetical protein
MAQIVPIIRFVSGYSLTWKLFVNQQTGDDALTIGLIGKEKRRYEPEEKSGEVFVPSPVKIQKGFGFKKVSRNLIKLSNEWLWSH